jgi:hypothetical protein
MEKTPLIKMQHEIEILLSHDFDAMSLKELKTIGSEITNLFSISQKEYGVGKIRLSNPQGESWSYVQFLTKKLEHENDFVKVGDLFASSWGYDQTNVEFFKVVGLTKSGKSARIRQIGMTSKSNDGGSDMSDSVTPDPKHEIKVKVMNEEKHYFEDTKEHLPDLTVRIEKSSQWNPRLHKRETIGETGLRGSVYYGCNASKHLESLSRIAPTESHYRSWYA